MWKFIIIFIQKNRKENVMRYNLKYLNDFIELCKNYWIDSTKKILGYKISFYTHLVWFLIALFKVKATFILIFINPYLIFLIFIILILKLYVFRKILTLYTVFEIMSISVISVTTFTYTFGGVPFIFLAVGAGYFGFYVWDWF